MNIYIYIYLYTYNEYIYIYIYIYSLVKSEALRVTTVHKDI